MNNFKLNRPKFLSISLTEKELFEDLRTIKKWESDSIVLWIYWWDMEISYKEWNYTMYRKEVWEFRKDEDGYECGTCLIGWINESYKTQKEVSEALLQYV